MRILYNSVGCIECPLEHDLECKVLHLPIRLVEGFRRDCPLKEEDILVTINHVRINGDVYDNMRSTMN
jgi:hypothetical protein